MSLFHEERRGRPCKAYWGDGGNLLPVVARGRRTEVGSGEVSEGVGAIA